MEDNDNGSWRDFKRQGTQLEESKGTTRRGKIRGGWSSDEHNEEGKELERTWERRWLG